METMDSPRDEGVIAVSAMLPWVLCLLMPVEPGWAIALPASNA